jgi:hypothetical protein
LWHVDQHGLIEDLEVSAMLDDKQLAEQYSELLPFAIDIETTKTGNKYHKRVLVLTGV